MVLNAKQDVDRLREVDVIASGYEWICPNCDNYNEIVAITDVIECAECKNLYRSGEANHAREAYRGHRQQAETSEYANDTPEPYTDADNGL